MLGTGVLPWQRPTDTCQDIGSAVPIHGRALAAAPVVRL